MNKRHLNRRRAESKTKKPNDVRLIDSDTFSVKVRHPDNGQPFAPELTMAIDARTLMVVGVHISREAAGRA